MSTPSYSDLVARIEALEASGGISLDQLPMADLMRRLEATWQPDGSVLLPSTVIPLVVSMPTAASDGQLVDYLADATNGVVWRFRYRSASSSGSKWEFVGGAAMYAEVLTSESTASTTYTALTTAGPSITVPLAGDYLIEVGSMVSNNTANVGSFHSYAVGGTGASDNDAARFFNGAAVVAGGGSVARPQRKTSVAAGASVASQYRVGGGTGSWANRWMKLTPIRVSA